MPDVPGSLSWKLGKSVVTLTLEKSFEALMLGRHMSITHDLLTWADEKRLERRNHELPPCTRGFHKRVCHLATRCLSWLKISCWVEKKVTFENWGPPQMHTARTCWFEEGNQQQIFKTSSHGTSVKSPHLIVSRFLKNAESSILLYGCDNFSPKNVRGKPENQWSLSMTCGSMLQVILRFFEAARLVLDAFAQKWARDSQRNMGNDFVPMCRIELGWIGKMYNKRGTCKVQETRLVYDILK